MIDLGFLQETFLRLLAGVPLTLQLAATSLSAGFIIALVLSLASRGKGQVLPIFIRSYVAVFRGTPLLVQIFLIYYGLGQFRTALQSLGVWGFFREPYWCVVLALTLNTAAYGTEIL